MQPLLIIEHFYYPPENTYPLSSQSLFILPQSMSVNNLFCLGLPILDISLESTIEYMTRKLYLTFI